MERCLLKMSDALKNYIRMPFLEYLSIYKMCVCFLILTSDRDYKFCKGPITIRRTLLPSFLVYFSTFAFFFNFSFMKKRNQSYRYRGLICITNIDNQDFNVHQGISLKEYIGISIFLIRCCSPPPPPPPSVIHNFLLIYSLPYSTCAL